MQIAQRSVSGERNQHDIPNPANINEHLIRPLVCKPPAQLANHRSSVLPPYLRLSNTTNHDPLLIGHAYDCALYFVQSEICGASHFR
jgi:hypothetical protein